MNQLTLFATPRTRPGPRGGPVEHYTGTGIGSAGWDSLGQFYWDLRRWLDGLEPDLVDVPARTASVEAFQLTNAQVRYFDQGGS